MKQQTTFKQIVEAADQLFYQQGFESTSFSDIAEVVKISRGNFYHHFKSKNEILNAVIEHRLENTRQLLNQWESENLNPQDRVQSFINILLMNMAKIKKYGCPVGTLCAELAKLQHPAQTDAHQLFSLFRGWLTQQFECMHLSQNADDLAMHVLSWSQGVATLAHVYQDERFIHLEITQISNWLKQLK